MTVSVFGTSAPAVNLSVAAEEIIEPNRAAAVFARILVLEIVEIDWEEALQKAADKKNYH